MKEHSPSSIRNVVFAGQSHSGKTTLLEACLHLAGATDRPGKVEDGNTLSDYMPEEVKRHSSIWATLLACEWRDTKINFIDCPGYADFMGEVCQAMGAVENVVLVANAPAGVEFGLEEAARLAVGNDLARFVFINQLDRERASFDAVYDQLRSRHRLPVVALTYPLGREAALRGYVDVLHQKAYADDHGKLTEVPIPDEDQPRIQELRQILVECAVETDDALMERYLEGGDIEGSEVTGLLKSCVQAGRCVPVLCGSASRQIGLMALLQALRDLALAPAEASGRLATAADGAPITVSADPAAPFSGYVWKTFSDPFTGRLALIKVVSGTLRKDADVVNLDRGHHEKLGHLYSALGKKLIDISSAPAGDLCVAVKLKGTTTGNNLGAAPSGARYARPEMPASLYSLAFEPATPGDDDKLGEALSRLAEEDPTLKVERRANTHQTVVSGLGDVHLSTLVARLKSGFGVEIKVADPKVPYRETVRKSVKYEGKLKKQSGGHGQFGDVWLQIEPAPDGAGFEFVDKIVGGVVPRSFIPAVEEGVREATREGPLAGFPLVDLKVTLFDGKYHDVDSSFQTFKVAGSVGLRGGAKEASPVLLEPIMEVTILVPEASAGEVVGDINSRRGHILGMEPGPEGVVRVKAQVPEAELTKYPIVLRSLTHGRGSFMKEFVQYSSVPENVARPIVEAYQQRHHAPA